MKGLRKTPMVLLIVILGTVINYLGDGWMPEKGKVEKVEILLPGKVPMDFSLIRE